MLFTKIRDVKSPSRGTDESAGLDLFVPNDHGSINLAAGHSVNVPSGLKVVLEEGTVGLILNKSGVGVKGALVGAQVIDSDYRGEIHLNVHNVSNKALLFEPGQKLVQMLILPILLPAVEEIGNKDYEENFLNTQRGEGGFGSTGLG